MKDRLEKFIKTEGLTPSRFAEIMGVQPSSISHILGGRNKPSFDFIEKMLQRFPKLNPDWLLLGKGNIYRSISDNTVTPITTSSSQATIIPAATETNDASNTNRASSSGDSMGTTTITENNQQKAAGSLFDFTDNLTPRESHKMNHHGQSLGKIDFQETNPSTHQTPEIAPNHSTQSKIGTTTRAGTGSKSQSDSQNHTRIMNDVRQTSGIERIIIFFKDKTFISYTPEE